MYELMKRIEELRPMQEAFEKHVQSVGEQALISISGSKVTPQTFVDACLSVWKNFNSMVLDCFEKDPGFVASLDKACKSYFNNNVVTKQANSSAKSPELLARFCDQLLKVGEKVAENVEETLEEIVTKFLQSSFCTLKKKNFFLGTDDCFQVLGRQRRFSQVLLKDAGQEIDHRNFCLGRPRVEHDSKDEGCLRVRIHF